MGYKKGERPLFNSKIQDSPALFLDSFSFQKKFQAQKDDNSQINFWSGSPWIRRLFGVCMLSTSCGGRGRGVFEDQQKAEEMVVQGYLGCSPHRNELQNRTWSACNHAEGTLWRWKAREMISAEDFVAIHSNTVLQLEMVQNLKMNKRASSWISSRVSFQESPGLAGLFGISVKFFFFCPPLSLASLHGTGFFKENSHGRGFARSLGSVRVPPTKEAARQNKVAIQAATLCFVAHVLHACCICSACVLRPCCMSSCASKRV